VWVLFRVHGARLRLLFELLTQDWAGERSASWSRGTLPEPAQGGHTVPFDGTFPSIR
jgi:hypothetical protein